MSTLKATLPPPNMLIAFEAAGRHLSFTRAALELHVTRVAVSQQINGLEKFLGVKLFQRLDRTIRFTPHGARYHAAITASLEMAMEATSALTRRPESHVVTVSATAGVITYWLMPNMGTLRAQHPHVELRLIVLDRTSVDEVDADLVVAYGNPPFSGAQSTLLVRQSIAPTCSAAYLENREPPRSIEELFEHPLIHLEGPYDRLTRWSTWFASKHVAMTKPKASITVDTYTNLVQAVLDGQGFGLIGPPLMERFLSNRLLVQPLRTDPVPCHGFHLVKPARARETMAAAQVGEWIRQTFGEPH
ncbi:LysR substrate-binding domain-containing protein [Pseudomonas sp. SMV7]|uniref:LysR substrate-binding domain-containing protein n=1 Tax=Pseudomonas sp. SMV7 TaxID=3390194 RepID=UPI003F85B0E5